MQGVDLSKSSDACSLTRNNEKFSGTYYKTGWFFSWKPFWEARLQLGRSGATYNFTEFYYCFDTQWETTLEMISCRREDICITSFGSEKFFAADQCSLESSKLSYLSETLASHRWLCRMWRRNKWAQIKHKNKQQINKWSQD